MHNPPIFGWCSRKPVATLFTQCGCTSPQIRARAGNLPSLSLYHLKCSTEPKNVWMFKYSQTALYIVQINWCNLPVNRPAIPSNVSALKLLYSPKRILAITIISLIMSDSYQALQLYQKDVHLEEWWRFGLMNFTFVARAVTSEHLIIPFSTAFKLS